MQYLTSSLQGSGVHSQLYIASTYSAHRKYSARYPHAFGGFRERKELIILFFLKDRLQAELHTSPRAASSDALCKYEMKFSNALKVTRIYK